MNHSFWNTQPINQNDTKNHTNDVIFTPNIENINSDPVKINNSFYWDILNINDNICEEISIFLEKYYVGSDEYRLYYSKDMIKWMLYPYNGIYLGVRIRADNRLVGIITANIKKNNICDKNLNTAEINLLCVHPKLRKKGLTVLLLKELTRRGYLQGLTTAVYTIGKQITPPISTADFYHYSINKDVLLETNFISPFKEVNVNLPKNTISKFKKMELSHTKQAFNIFNNYINRFKYYPIMDYDEFVHTFINDFVISYVIEKDGVVEDFISYYILPYKVLSPNKYKYINAGYLYYHTCSKNTFYMLLKNILIIAKKNNIDTFNVLNIMDHKHVLDTFGFNKGTGTVNYYIYNFSIKKISNSYIAKYFI